MTLFRLIGNLVLLTVYLARMAVYLAARLCGSIIGVIAIIGVTLAYFKYHSGPAILFYLPIFFALICRKTYPYLRVGSRPRFLRAPAPPPPPTPIASAAKGRGDDPDEATVVGRLDPRLRELLRQKADGPAS